MNLAELILGPLQYGFMQRALIASMLVGLVCGTLGCYIVLRRMALIGDALSHAVLPGAAIAFMLGATDFFFGAAVAGIITAVLIGWVTANSRVKEDAAIGVIFTGAFALGIVLITLIQSRSVDLFHMLFGNVLGVEDRDLWVTAGITVTVLLTVALLYKEMLLHSFDQIMAAALGLPIRGLHYLLMVLLSLTVVASLQTVGLVLVVAMLITPASTAYLLTDRFGRMLGISAGIGVLSSVAGLYGSYYWNVSSGAAIVLVATALFFVALLFSPQRGLVIRWFRTRSAAIRTSMEDTLKHVYALNSAGNPATAPAMAARMGMPAREAGRRLARLRGAGLVRGDELTEQGEERAVTVVRAHRLWERYLVEEGVTSPTDVHGEAERLEHIAPDTMAEKLDEVLGSPTADPHGQPIPRRQPASPPLATVPRRTLAELQSGERGRVLAIGPTTRDGLHHLAELSLAPPALVEVVERNGTALRIRTGSEIHSLDTELARAVLVE
ncbi:MAG: metal ABC transporter permease [Gemmatimonadetes bacterium]|nr:metal ABC transporter permease [Gemmatimonadota bacterium]